MRSSICLCIASLLLPAVLPACGGDPDPTGDPQGSTGGGGNGSTGESESSGGKLSLVINYLGTPIGGLTVEITTNDCSGTVLDSAVTDGNGRVAFSGLEASDVAAHVVAAKGVAGSDWVDTWTYDVKVDKPESPTESVNVLQVGTLPTVEGSAGDYTPDPSMGAVIGATYLGDANRPQDRDYLGCMRIVLSEDPENDSVRYAGPEGLPSDASAQPETRNETGRFYIGNVAPGAYTLKAVSRDGSELASAKVCVRPRDPVRGTIALVGVYVPETAQLGECPY